MNYGGFRGIRVERPDRLRPPSHLKSFSAFGGFSSAGSEANIWKTSTDADRQQKRNGEMNPFLFGPDFTVESHWVTGASEEIHNLLWGESTVTVQCIMGASRHTVKHERGKDRATQPVQGACTELGVWFQGWSSSSRTHKSFLLISLLGLIMAISPDAAITKTRWWTGYDVTYATAISVLHSKNKMTDRGRLTTGAKCCFSGSYQHGAVTWLQVFHGAACKGDESSVITLGRMSSNSCLQLMRVPIVSVWLYLCLQVHLLHCHIIQSPALTIFSELV